MYLQDEDGSHEVPRNLWSRRGTIFYNAGGERDVLILAPDLSLPHPEAVPRRPGQLTQEDKIKLQSQGLPPESCHNEVTIVRTRHELDKRQKYVEVKSGQSFSREVIMKCLAHLLLTTKNNGGKYTDGN